MADSLVKTSHQINDPYTSSVVDNAQVNQFVVGPDNILYQRLNFQGSPSNSSASISVFPPSTDTVISKCLYIELEATFDSTQLPSAGTGTNTMDNFSAPRQFPVNNAISQCRISINGVSTSTQPKTLIHPLARYMGNGFFRTRFQGMTPSMPDPASEYALCLPYTQTTYDLSTTATVGSGTDATDLGVVNVGTATSFTITTHHNNSPWSTEFYRRHDYEMSRAEFPYTTSGNTAQNRKFVFVEPLLHGLLNMDDSEEAFANVRELQIDLQFFSNLRHAMWSDGGGTDQTNLSCTLGLPKLYIAYRQPNATVSIPQSLALPYQGYVHQQKALSNQLAATGGTASETVVFNNIVLGQVPSRIFVWAREREQDRNSSRADGFLRIDSINFSINTRSGILSGLNTQGLYQLSCDNGLKGINYNQWDKRLGSVLCVDVAKDIGGLIPGKVGNVSMSFDVKLTNTQWNNEASTTSVGNKYFDVHMLAILDGQATITPDSMVLSLGADLNDEAEAQANGKTGEGFIPSHYDYKHQGSGVLGGKFNLKKFVKGSIHGLAGLGKIAQSTGLISPQAQAGLSVLNAVDSGVNKRGRGLLIG